MALITNASISFGLVEHDHWFQPDSIDEEKAKAGRDKMTADNIIYGGSVSYVLFINIQASANDM